MQESIKTHRKNTLLQNEIRDLKRKLKKVSISEEKIYRLIESAAIEDETPYVPKEFQIKTKSKDAALILPFNDWHYAEVVEEDEVMGQNKYNPDIAEDRAYKWRDSIMNIQRDVGVDSALLVFNGDNVSGLIHDELRETNALVSGDMVKKGSRVLVNIASSLAQIFDFLKIHGTVGNHGRLTDKVRHKHKIKDNLEYIMLYILQTSLEVMHDNIEFNIPMSSFFVEKFKEMSIMITHGDLTKGGGGFLGLPLYGISRDTAKIGGGLDLMGGDNYDMALLAHFHILAQFCNFSQKPVYINPSIIGTTEFSLNVIKSFSKPEHIALLIEGKSVKQIFNIEL